MLEGVRRSLVWCAGLFIFSNALGSPPAAPLSGIVQGNGSLVALKAFTIPGVFSDGAAFYNRMITYQEAGPSGLTCDVTYSTAKNESSNTLSTPGQDAVFHLGDSAPWSTSDGDGTRFSSRALDSGAVVQSLSLAFSSLGNSPVMYVSCTAMTSADTILTVADFEAAVGGLFTLRVSP